MFGRDTHSPKTNKQKPFVPTPLRTITIDEVLTPIPKLGTQEPYYESYLWWKNPENTVTLGDIAALYEHQYGEHVTYKTPSENLNSILYTQYPEAINTQVSVLRYR